VSGTELVGRQIVTAPPKGHLIQSSQTLISSLLPLVTVAEAKSPRRQVVLKATKPMSGRETRELSGSEWGPWGQDTWD
jgi:hypothetical protein